MKNKNNVLALMNFDLKYIKFVVFFKCGTLP